MYVCMYVCFMSLYLSLFSFMKIMHKYIRGLPSTERLKIYVLFEKKKHFFEKKSCFQFQDRKGKACSCSRDSFLRIKVSELYIFRVGGGGVSGKSIL